MAMPGRIASGGIRDARKLADGTRAFELRFMRRCANRESSDPARAARVRLRLWWRLE